MTDHQWMPGVAVTEREGLCPASAIVDVARSDLGRGWTVRVCDSDRGGCGRSTLPYKRREQTAVKVKLAPRTGYKPPYWAR